MGWLLTRLGAQVFAVAFVGGAFGVALGIVLTMAIVRWWMLG